MHAHTRVLPQTTFGPCEGQQLKGLLPLLPAFLAPCLATPIAISNSLHPLLLLQAVTSWKTVGELEAKNSVCLLLKLDHGK